MLFAVTRSLVPDSDDARVLVETSGDGWGESDLGMLLRGDPVVFDDGDDTAAGAFGLNAVPFWVLVNTDNTVAGRGAGAVPAEVLTQVATDLAAGPSS
mgnify:CR=1 FL=1